MKLPKSYIKKYGISKQAWKEYKASLKKPKKSKRRTIKKKVIRVKRAITKRRSMPRKKKKYRRKNRLAIAPTIGVLSSFAKTAPSGRTLIQDLMKGDIEGLMYDGREIFTGIDAQGGFHWDWLMTTYAPMFFGVIAHRIANALGVNRYMRQIPLLGNYVQV